MDMSESESTERMAYDCAPPIPPPSWAARRDWLPPTIQPDAERATSFSSYELARLKFTKWLIETGRLVP
jgi:hypothetical protein